MQSANHLAAYVFPTRVGVNRADIVGAEALAGFPHARGGEPLAAERAEREAAFSPRAWG